MNIIIVECRSSAMEQYHWRYTLAAVDLIAVRQAIDEQFSHPSWAGQWSKPYGDGYFTYIRRRVDDGGYQTIRFHEERLIGTVEQPSSTAGILVQLAE